VENQFQSMCPKYEKAVELLGKRWTALILYCLIDRARRFTEIKEFVPGLSDRLLSERLQELEEAGVVERRVHASRPILIEYVLTPKGADLRMVVEAIAAWAHKWDPAPDPVHSPR
jgi:DNA-binding HxlR family transcriptional regulator